MQKTLFTIKVEAFGNWNSLLGVCAESASARQIVIGQQNSHGNRLHQETERLGKRQEKTLALFHRYTNIKISSQAGESDAITSSCEDCFEQIVQARVYGK